MKREHKTDHFLFANANKEEKPIGIFPSSYETMFVVNNRLKLCKNIGISLQVFMSMSKAL